MALEPARRGRHGCVPLTYRTPWAATITDDHAAAVATSPTISHITKDATGTTRPMMAQPVPQHVQPLLATMTLSAFGKVRTMLRRSSRRRRIGDLLDVSACSGHDADPDLVHGLYFGTGIRPPPHGKRAAGILVTSAAVRKTWKQAVVDAHYLVSIGC